MQTYLVISTTLLLISFSGFSLFVFDVLKVNLYGYDFSLYRVNCDLQWYCVTLQFKNFRFTSFLIVLLVDLLWTFCFISIKFNVLILLIVWFYQIFWLAILALLFYCRLKRACFSTSDVSITGIYRIFTEINYIICPVLNKKLEMNGFKAFNEFVKAWIKGEYHKFENNEQVKKC